MVESVLLNPIPCPTPESNGLDEAVTLHPPPPRRAVSASMPTMRACQAAHTTAGSKGTKCPHIIVHILHIGANYFALHIQLISSKSICLLFAWHAIFNPQTNKEKSVRNMFCRFCIYVHPLLVQFADKKNQGLMYSTIKVRERHPRPHHEGATVFARR
jgi:hypothetical protein